MIEFINRNPGVTALCAVLAASGVLLMVFSALLKRQSRRTAAMLRRLDQRVMGSGGQLRASVDTLSRTMNGAAANLSAVSDSMEARQERMRREMAEKLEIMRLQNEQKLEAMGAGMQRTLEARLGESFRLVNGQLENVYRGVGEMRKLAEGVGDLKRVLSGVKTRGIWGEARLRAILSESLTNSQYEENVAVVPGSQERVEFAVRLPGRDEGAPVWLAVDSKFPLEDYQRLIESGERGDANDVKTCAQALENAVLEQARRISRYIDPPHTADFAVMFLPAESLYGEVLARPGLIQKLQSRYHVLPAGPGSFQALVNCLQMGFRTLTMEKRSAEILRMLGSVRQEFARFGETLDKARTRLEMAAGDLDSVGVRTRAINRKLSDLETDEPGEAEKSEAKA